MRTKALTPVAAPVLRALADEIRAIEPFEALALETRAKTWLERAHIPLKDMAQPGAVASRAARGAPDYSRSCSCSDPSALARLERAAVLAEAAR